MCLRGHFTAFLYKFETCNLNSFCHCLRIMYSKNILFLGINKKWSWRCKKRCSILDTRAATERAATDSPVAAARRQGSNQRSPTTTAKQTARVDREAAAGPTGAHTKYSYAHKSIKGEIFYQISWMSLWCSVKS